MEVFTKYDDKIVTMSEFKFVFMLTVSTFLPKIELPYKSVIWYKL